MQKNYAGQTKIIFREIKSALEGISTNIVSLNQKDEIIISVAVPIIQFGDVIGVLILSTEGGEIDMTLWRERKHILHTFLFAALVTALLSVILAGTIAEPIRALAEAATQVRKGLKKRIEMPDFTQRNDEIGHLSIALRDMTDALYQRINAIESFAADVSHEIKNPLTSLRSAVESLSYARNVEQREKLVEIVKHDVLRLDRLITDIAHASRIDAELAREEMSPINIKKLVLYIIEITNEIKKSEEGEIIVNINPKNADWTIAGHEGRLGQVIGNLFDNARSFSPKKKPINVNLTHLGNKIEFAVSDHGKGIHQENIEKIFERFYSDRDDNDAFGNHSGLGLFISRQIIDAHGGKLWAENIYHKNNKNKNPSGAKFIISFPKLGKQNNKNENISNRPKNNKK